jgi:hypothetical protein
MRISNFVTAPPSKPTNEAIVEDSKSIGNVGNGTCSVVGAAQNTSSLLLFCYN